MDFLKQFIGGPGEVDVEALKSENEELKKKVEQLEAKIEELSKKASGGEVHNIIPFDYLYLHIINIL